MRKTLEAIKNGQKVATEEAFGLVNSYDITHLSITDMGKTTLSMQVNKFDIGTDTYTFSQECAAHHNQYTLNKDDVLFADAEWNEKANAIFITGHMKDDKKLQIMILFPSESFKESISEGFLETDVYDIQEFLDDVIHEKNEWYIILARITDVFGFDLKMKNPFRTYVNTLDDSDWKLHISDDVNTFEVPVTDDSVNLFYMKETDSTKEIIVKPYGQSFMEIKMLFFKKHEQ